MHNALTFRSTSMLMFGRLVRKTQANDLNDHFEFSRSRRKLLKPLQFSVIVAHMWRIYTLPKEVVFNIDDIVYFQD